MLPVSDEYMVMVYCCTLGVGVTLIDFEGVIDTDGVLLTDAEGVLEVLGVIDTDGVLEVLGVIDFEGVLVGDGVLVTVIEGVHLQEHLRYLLLLQLV